MAKGIIIREAHFPGKAPIEAYGNGGFRFADMSHRGSLLCLPSGIHGWEPADPSALKASDFAHAGDSGLQCTLCIFCSARGGGGDRFGNQDRQVGPRQAEKMYVAVPQSRHHNFGFGNNGVRSRRSVGR